MRITGSVGPALSSAVLALAKMGSTVHITEVLPQKPHSCSKCDGTLNLKVRTVKFYAGHPDKPKWLTVTVTVHQCHPWILKEDAWQAITVKIHQTNEGPLKIWENEELIGAQLLAGNFIDPRSIHKHVV